uniref:Uncharacterized protein n=1 Tax=Arundo donax TaxID=35708 RepID=A0A0A9A8R9_ARUDO
MHRPPPLRLTTAAAAIWAAPPSTPRFAGRRPQRPGPTPPPVAPSSAAPPSPCRQAQGGWLRCWRGHWPRGAASRRQ